MSHFVRFISAAFARVVAGNWLRSALGALIGIAVAGAITTLMLGGSSAFPLLAVPIGASAVLLFAVPASPLAQPWAILGGNVVSALVGVTVASLISSPLVASAVAVAAAIAAMSRLRCLHPPGGAIALLAVLDGPHVAQLADLLALAPILVNSALLALVAVFYNHATGHSYPHRARPPENAHPLNRKIVLTDEEFDAVLADYGEALDISRDDLVMLYRELRGRAELKRAKRKFRRPVSLPAAGPCSECGALKFGANKIGSPDLEAAPGAISRRIPEPLSGSASGHAREGVRHSVRELEKPDRPVDLFTNPGPVPVLSRACCVPVAALPPQRKSAMIGQPRPNARTSRFPAVPAMTSRLATSVKAAAGLLA